MTSAAGSLVVRFYYQNERSAAADPTTVPELEIARETDGSGPTPAADDATIAKRLERVANWVRSKYGYQVLSVPGRPLPGWFSSTPNTLGRPEDWEAAKEGGGWGAVDAASAGSSGSRRDVSPSTTIMTRQSSCQSACF